MKKAVLLILCVIFLAAFGLANTEPVMPAIETVLDTERPKDVDILLLRNGDKLTGTVVNENFSIRTSYAHIVIETKYIAGINLEGGANNIESIITVNNNRFSGFIDDAFISFKLTNGPQLEIRREKVLKIVFRQRPQETAGMKWRQFMQLKNGDYFHGQILTKDITISTTYAKIPLDFATTESITLIGDANPLTTVKMTNGDTVQGILETEDIEIELDVGSVIEVYQDRIDRIFFKEGYVPDSIPSIVTSSTTAKGNLLLVEKGSFTMGDTWGGGDSDEKPTHKVTFTYNFYIRKYETTFDEYDAFCEATGKSSPDDENWGRGNRPVINVSWNDAIAYCNWMSDKEKLPKVYDSNGNLLDKNGSITTDPSKVVGYRLPTDAEWEYAARGDNKSMGYKYSGSDNVDEVAWYTSNSGGKTHEIGTKTPNDLDIHDMSGNVWEWCSDWYDSGYYAKSPTTNPYNYTPNSHRVFRGGSCYSSATYVHLANRNSSTPTYTRRDLGFRISRTVP
jgi:formylglycine-generating enzyme required for sulfatase activity